MLAPFSQGFGLGGGLIVAIGAQNAFVLSQGVRRNHHFTVALICACCDLILIMAGALGVGAAVSRNPVLLQVAAWGGAAFLAWYGWRAFCSAMQGGRLQTQEYGGRHFRQVVLATLAVTLLNPHVYLDTVLLLGGVSGQFPGQARYYFAAGAGCASIIWFFGLSLGGQLLAPFFKKVAAWRVLDSLVCLTMWSIAVSLAMHALAR